MLHNRELQRDLYLLLGASALFTAIGFWVSIPCGLLVFCACVSIGLIHFLTEVYRYRRLRRLCSDLDRLLYDGTPLPIRAYTEGELSILAAQIQKLALHLSESAEALQSDKAYLADALADISHQLRTPLSAMNLTASMLAAPALPAERQQVLTMELRNLLSRTEWLVEALLKLSKLDAGTVNLAREPVPVHTLIRQAADPLAIPMELREQKLVIRCEAQQFLGDSTWTAEALGNILKNCMEHTPAGGTVTVAARETSLFTEITVEDTGPGFNQTDIPRLFERFYKGSNAAANSYGIGLALARTIITAQNGTVQASNTPTGARFTIKFYKQVI